MTNVQGAQVHTANCPVKLDNSSCLLVVRLLLPDS